MIQEYSDFYTATSRPLAFFVSHHHNNSKKRRNGFFLRRRKRDAGAEPRPRWACCKAEDTRSDHDDKDRGGHPSTTLKRKPSWFLPLSALFPRSLPINVHSSIVLRSMQEEGVFILSRPRIPTNSEALRTPKLRRQGYEGETKESPRRRARCQAGENQHPACQDAPPLSAYLQA